MKILVTGGAGFIGSNLVYQLISLGGEVLVVDNLSTGSIENLQPSAGFRKLDVLDDAFIEVCREFAPDTIVHLAAQSSISQSLLNSDETMRINVEGVRRVAEAALATQVERVVFASSAAVYGEPAELPLRETSVKAPLNPYGESKLAGEHLLAELLRPAGIDFACPRFSNVYGPRQSAQGEAGVVAAFCSRIASGLAPVVKGDGSQQRDFIYVADVVASLISFIGGDIDFAADTSADGPAFNISTGKSTDLTTLLMELRRASGFHEPAETAPALEHEVHTSVLAPDKAREVFEWEPEVEFDSGITATWMWFKAHTPASAYESV